MEERPLNAPSSAPGAPGTSSDRTRAIAVPLALLLLAALLYAGPWKFKSPVEPAAAAPAWATNPAPIRTPRFEPKLQVSSFTYRCSDCHSLFDSPPETTRQLTQHREIILKHGLNTRCFNCHNRENRNAFVDDAGGEIPYDQPQVLCARCHGTVFRDWENGVHGRTNGYWEKSKGVAQRLRCIQCHDPHEPPFPPMHPAPGPKTLRMGDQSQAPHGDEHNPLRVYRRDIETHDSKHAPEKRP